MQKRQEEVISISPPKFRKIRFRIKGTAPYMQCRFSKKALDAMKAQHIAGPTAKKNKARVARDFDADFEGAKHISSEGWVGIPASSFRNACIDVCRMVGFKMTHAKMSVFVEADGIDALDGTPLIRIEGDCEKTEMPVRNATGVIDIRVRPLWRTWSASVVMRFDSDQFSPKDVVNLLSRAGAQVGIGEGRPYSKQSNGLGFGLFEIDGADE